MMERLRFWNQYGYQPDVFKKYRDAVVSAVFNNGGAGRNSSCSAFYI